MNICHIRSTCFDRSTAINSVLHRAYLSWVLSLAVFLTACGGSSAPTEALSITAHPADQSVVVGSPAQFAVEATGSGALTYQWQRNGSDIAGAQSSSYTLGAATIVDSGSNFTVIVSDDNASVTSAAAALTVTPNPVAPAIVAPPAGTSAVVGEVVNFTVTASGTAPFTYQWQRNGTDVPGETSSTLNWTAALVDNAAQFRVLVSNAAGSVTSAFATLAVAVAPVAPTITTQPSATIVTAPASASFTVVSTGTPPLSYQWQRGGVDIAGANAVSFTTPATVLADNGSLYSVIVSNASGSITSSAATLTVIATAVAPTITTQPTAQSIEQGQQATFTVVAAGTAPFTYQWQRNGNNIAGANTASYTTPVLTQAADNGAIYRVIVTNSVASVTSTAVAVSVTQTLLACSGGAQAGWCWVEPKPHGNPVRDVQYLGGDVFVAAGGGGTFMRSTDAGATWSTSFAIGSSVNAMHFVSSSLGFAVGDQGFIARTNDGGQTWTPQTSSVQTTLNDVHFFDANLGLAVGDSNTMLRSTDGGATWTKITMPPHGNAYGVRFANANIAVAVGSNGARLRSTDGGASWTRLDTPVAGCQTCTLRSVAFTSATTGFAVGDQSNSILRTDDAGLTWASVPGANAAGATDGSCGFGAIDFSGANGIAAATCGWVAHTSDGGVTWTKFPAVGLKLETDTYGVAFGTGAVAVAVGGEGQIYRTTNAGVSWTSIFPQRDGQALWNVYFDNASTAYIVGTKSYKSTDGGLSWAQDTSLPSGMRARTSVNGAVITAGSNYSINRSTDGGLTWSNVYFLAGSSTLDSFYFYNSSLGYAYGKTAGGTIRTTDGGLTWAPVPWGLGTAVGVHFFGDLVGVYVGEGRIYRTVNGGANWSQVQYSSQRFVGAAFTGNSGVAVGLTGTMYSTSNQGLTWTQITGVTEHFRGVQSTSSGSSYVAYTDSGRMLRSVDGSTWNPLASPVSGQINAIRYYDDSLGLAVGNAGIILRTTTGGQ